MKTYGMVPFPLLSVEPHLNRTEISIIANVISFFLSLSLWPCVSLSLCICLSASIWYKSQKALFSKTAASDYFPPLFLPSYICPVQHLVGNEQIYPTLYILLFSIYTIPYILFDMWSQMVIGLEYYQILHVTLGETIDQSRMEEMRCCITYAVLCGL